MKTTTSAPSAWMPRRRRSPRPPAGGRPARGRRRSARAAPPVAGAARSSSAAAAVRSSGQAVDVEHARDVHEPVTPERPRVAERVEVGCDPHRAEPPPRGRCRFRTPTASMRTSSGRPAGRGRSAGAPRPRPRRRPRERGTGVPSARRRRAEHGVLGRMRDLAQHESQPPRPVPRSGTDERAKIRAAQPTTGAQRRSGDGHRPMIGSAPHRSTVREPGASPGRSRRCEGEQPPRKRHWPRGWEGRGGGAPSQKTCRAPPSNPSRKEDSCFAGSSSSRCSSPPCSRRPRSRRTSRSASRAGRQTIFGTVQPSLQADNALQALDVASPAGEFHYAVTTASFGDYVSQIGKYAAAGSAGWAFKVNGVSPPVGADKVVLKDGDVVLWYWATFGAAGGPPTLDLRRAARQLLRRRIGQRRRPPTRGRPRDAPRGRKRFPVGNGRACIGSHTGLVRATAPGAVRSNSVR